MKVVWTDLAEQSLSEIEYFLQVVQKLPRNTVSKIINAIFDKAASLKKMPARGPVETFLIGNKYGHEFHYLVVRNYKLIYRFTEDTVLISMILDTRMDPKNLRSRLEM